MNVLFNCLAATRLISKSQHQKLSTLDSVTLGVHVSMCKYCKSFQKDLDFVQVQLLKIEQEEGTMLNKTYKKELAQTVLEAINNPI